MIIEKNRHMNELLYLFNLSTIATAEELASYTNSSNRTIKNDIKFLNEELKEDGCEIISHKGKGYRIVIHNEEKAEALKYKVEVLNCLFGDKSIIDTSRWLFIVQKLLTLSEIKKEQLCESLYLSESGIAPHLVKACSFLNSFGLEVQSNGIRGLFIKGKEQDIRSCCVEVASSSYHETELLYPVDEFEKMIYPSYDIYQNVRHAFLKILRESKVSVSDISSKKLATHLCLIKERSNSGFHPKIKKSMQQEILQTYEYSLAKSIFKDSTICSYFGLQEELEIMNFARLLIINRDIDLQSQKDAETILPKYIIENRKITKHVLGNMKNNSSYKTIFSMDIIQRYEIDFESLFMQIYFKHHFDILSKERLVTYMEKEEQLLSPMAKDISRNCIELLEKEFMHPIQTLESQSIAGLIDLILQIIQYHYHKLNLSMTSLQGRAIGKIIKNNLMDKYSNYISNIEVYDLYEMRKLNFENYSAVIIHGKTSLYFSYPCKFVALEPFDAQVTNINEKLFDDLIIDSYSKKILKFIKEKISIYENVQTESIHSFFSLISYKYAKSDTDRNFLYNHIINREKITSYIYNNGIGVVILDYDHTGKEFFDIYGFEHSIRSENDYLVKYIVVLSIDSNRPPQEIKEINKLIQENILSPDILTTLIKDKNSLDITWRKIMKNHFLSNQ